MKFLRYLKKKRRAMLALAALTFFSNPFAAQASNITTKAGVTLNPTNNVYNIEVQQKLSNAVGVNKFTDFTLDKGHIANMQFDKLNTLANLVDNKIDINGTVNALRNGKIGGNLYFLSPNGIAVGATGVINAGSFTGIAAGQEYFDELSKMTDAAKFTKALEADNIVYNNDPDKGIDIQGVINAPGGINLHATKIDVGSGAILRTDVSDVDFSKVVNIDSVDSGITGGLDAEYKDGDIVIKAHAESIADASTLKDDDDEALEKAAENWKKISTNEATINIDGTIKSANDVSINAEAVTVFKETKDFNVLTQTSVVKDLVKNFNLDVAANYAKKTNKAVVNIGKTADIYSKGDMDISATANLNIEIETATPAKGKGNTWIPATAVAVVSADNEAVVNVEGKLHSEGKMSINATAETTLTVDAKTKTKFDDDDDKDDSESDDDDKDKDSSNTDDSSDTDKNSSNTDDSSDTDKDSSKTDDSSDTDKDSSNTDDSSDSDEDSFKNEDEDSKDRFYIAVGIIDGTSKAEVNIKSGSEIKADGEDSKDDDGNPISAFSANAVVKNIISNSVNASSEDNSTINTAVGVVSYTSDAILNIDSDITAENGSINVNATNTTVNVNSTSSL